METVNHGEEIHRIKNMGKSTGDEYPKERSKRLNSILGRMREGQEQHIIDITGTKPIYLYEERPQHMMTQSVERFDSRVDVIDVRERDVSPMQREEIIRDQINRAVRDQMMATTESSPKGPPVGEALFSSSTFSEDRTKNRSSPSTLGSVSIQTEESYLPSKTTKPTLEITSGHQRVPSMNEKSEQTGLDVSSSESGSIDSSLDSGNTSTGYYQYPDKVRMHATKKTNVMAAPVKYSTSQALKNSSQKPDAFVSRSLSLSETENETDGGSVDTYESSERTESESGSSSDSTISTAKDRRFSIRRSRQSRYESRGRDAPVDELPLSVRASDFVSMMVGHLNLNEPFFLPSNIKDHAKSQPIDDDSESETDGDNETDNNSIVGRWGRSVMKKKVTAFKPATLGRHQLMLDLKEATPARLLKSRSREKQMETHQPVGLNRVDNTEQGASPQQDADQVPGDCGVQALNAILPVFGSLQNHHEIEWKGKQKEALADAFKSKSTLSGVAVAGQIDLTLAASSGSAARAKDDGESLEYSCGTDEGMDTDAPVANRPVPAKYSPDYLEHSDSDASSMVALKHGYRGNARTSMSTCDSSEEGTKNREIPTGNPRPTNSVSGNVVSLQVALSRSGESTDLVDASHALKQPKMDKPSLDGDVLGEACKSPNAALAQKDPRPSESTSPRFSESHQNELREKIAESQHRRSSKASSLEYYEYKSTENKNFKLLPKPQIKLPVASKEIAKSYVNALSMKYHPSEGGTFASSQGVKQRAIPTLQNTGTVHTIVTTETSGQSAFGRSENDTIATESVAKEHAVDYEQVVNKIDGVVNRLIKSGKHGDNDSSSPKISELEQRTLKKNTTELLQNLAILRSRKDSPASSLSHSAARTSSLEERKGSRTKEGKSRAMKKAQDVPFKRQYSFESSNLAALRARRNQAAIAIRNSAERLNGWSQDSNEQSAPKTESRAMSSSPNRNAETSRRSQTTTRRPSAAKRIGPPKPESMLSKTSGAKNSKLATTVVDCTGLDSRGRVVDSGPNLDAPRNPIATIPQVLDLTDWEEDQFQKLPMILQDLSDPVTNHSDNYFAYEEPEDDDTAEFTYDTTASDDDDDASDSDTQRLDRIENMIREIRARRRAK